MALLDAVAKALASTTPSSSTGERQAVLAALPWLLSGFCAAAQQYRRLADIDAAAAGLAGAKRPAEGAGEAGAAGAAATGGIAKSAEFHFFVALASCFPGHLALLQQAPGAAGTAAAVPPAVAVTPASEHKGRKVGRKDKGKGEGEELGLLGLLGLLSLHSGCLSGARRSALG